MRIAVDARELVGHATGVGRYLGELLTEWSSSRVALAHQWLLYAPQRPTVPASFDAGVRVLPGHAGTMWEQWRLSRALAADTPDVLFAPAYTAPLAVRCPVVLTIHDASFAAHPEWFRFREGARRRTLTRLSAMRARAVLTDSEFSRGEIVRHLGVAPAQARVIALGVRQPTEAAAPGTRARQPLVLFVGSIFARRHVDSLIRAFATHVAPRIEGSRLEIVGENRAFPRLDLTRVLAEQRADARQRITVRSYVDERTLADLYASASVFAFPSEYEGFGLTPLEALAAGVPPVVVDTPIAREVYGPAARYIPLARPLDQALGEAIGHLLASEPARHDLLRHAPEVLARYRWDRAAAETLAVLEDAARG